MNYENSFHIEIDDTNHYESTVGNARKFFKAFFNTFWLIIYGWIKIDLNYDLWKQLQPQALIYNAINL